MINFLSILFSILCLVCVMMAFSFIVSMPFEVILHRCNKEEAKLMAFYMIVFIVASFVFYKMSMSMVTLQTLIDIHTMKAI